jgi:hypothetical protein
MIKLIALFLTLNIANGQTISYLLPDEKALFEHTLMTHIKKATKEIVILTPALNYPLLRRQLIHSVSKGVKLTLIAQNLSNDPLQLVAYNGVELYGYDVRPLGDTSIVIDDTTVCHLSGVLSEEKFMRNTQQPLCSDEEDIIHTTQQNVRRILTRSKPYLK